MSSLLRSNKLHYLIPNTWVSTVPQYTTFPHDAHKIHPPMLCFVVPLSTKVLESPTFQPNRSKASRLHGPRSASCASIRAFSLSRLCFAAGLLRPVISEVVLCRARLSDGDIMTFVGWMVSVRAFLSGERGRSVRGVGTCIVDCGSGAFLAGCLKPVLRCEPGIGTGSFRSEATFGRGWIALVIFGPLAI